jgi:hypothetical protein
VNSSDKAKENRKEEGGEGGIGPSCYDYDSHVESSLSSDDERFDGAGMIGETDI